MRLAEIMSRDVQTVRESERAELVWQKMQEKGIRHMVVTENREVVGVITDRDLGGKRGRRMRAERLVRDLMTRNPITVGPRTTVRQAANRMRHRIVGSLIVAEDGKMRGIVTMSDLLDLIGRGLEVPTRTKERRTGRRPGAAREALSGAAAKRRAR